jgi:ATP-dependent RNA helicase SUPV3L1/SUV3
MRDLAPNELAQIAGRAGRAHDDGTFGVTGEAPPLDDEVAEAIMEHRFTPIRAAMAQRRAGIRLGRGADRLARGAPRRRVAGARARGRRPDGAEGAGRGGRGRGPRLGPRDGAAAVGCLPDPDFRGISHAEHAGLLERSSGSCTNAARAGRLAGAAGRGSTGPTAISTRCRNGWRISAHGPTSRSARAGWTTKAIGARRPAL